MMASSGEDERFSREAIAAGDSAAWNKLGILLARQPGREHDAEQAYREAIEAGQAAGWCGLGLLLGQPDRGPEAAQALGKCPLDLSH